jgi:phage tail sheath protein FI
LAHEPNDIRLWVRIMREVSAHLEGLYQRGVLRGVVPEEAFYVKCDHETNPPSVVDAGIVVTEVGLAPAVPAEFIVVRAVQSADGVMVSAG